jgi:hypothetical protein
MVPPSETILEQQRRLLARVESIEDLARSGQLGECLRLIEDFKSDLGSAIDAPILLHLQSKLALIQNRVRSLAATASQGSGTTDPKVDAEYDPLAPYRRRWRGAVPALDSEACAAPHPRVDAEYDPLVASRGSIGEAELAPDLNGPVASVPDTTQIWWRCSRNSQHQPWKATKAQTARGRPCPSCMAKAGIPPDAWLPTDTQRSHSGRDAHNHAMLSNLRNQ